MPAYEEEEKDWDEFRAKATEAARLLERDGPCEPAESIEDDPETLRLNRIADERAAARRREAGSHNQPLADVIAEAAAEWVPFCPSTSIAAAILAAGWISEDDLADILDREEMQWTRKADPTLTEIEMHAADAVLRNLRSALFPEDRDEEVV